MIRLTAALLALAACQSETTSNKEPAPAETAAPASAYHADVERICDVEKLSGADAEETTARSIIAAEWLGRNLETDEARELLAEVARLGAADKAKRLREEARGAGLKACPTAAAWEREIGGREPLENRGGAVGE